MRLDTLKQLMSFNTQVNQHSGYLGNDVKYNLHSLNKDWQCLNDMFSENQ